MEFKGSKGIRQWTINGYTHPKMDNIIIPSVDYNYSLKSLDSSSMEITNQLSIEVLKVFKQMHIITLGTSVIYSLMSPPSP